MRLTFYGAVRKVTGSKFLLELDDEYRILIDCGTDLDTKSDPNNENDNYFGNFPFDASLINLVLLTHAHIDHSGQIPNLYVEGFEGQVLCTSPTLDLTELLLYDAASLNQNKLKKLEKIKNRSKKFRAIDSKGLFLSRQVKEAIGNFVPIAFNNRFRFKDNGYVTFIPAGHLLGAAHLLIEVMDGGVMKKICFSGDIGRENYPLLVDPQKIPQVDYLVMESTYGRREHLNHENPEDLLEEIIREACIDIPGRLIIPAFSVGRTQAMLYTLNRLYAKNVIKPIKVFTDSPLAKASTKVYEKYSKSLNAAAREFKEDNDLLFDFENLIYLESDKASREISNHGEPCVIISSSGMIQGGRIEHHIEKNIENPYATILLIGYATEGSIGAKLASGEVKELTINGKKLEVRAKVKRIDVFSGHGDINDLLRFIGFQEASKLKNVFLVHGDLDSMYSFKEVLNQKGFDNVMIPELNQSYEI